MLNCCIVLCLFSFSCSFICPGLSISGVCGVGGVVGGGGCGLYWNGGGGGGGLLQERELW